MGKPIDVLCSVSEHATCAQVMSGGSCDKFIEGKCSLPHGECQMQRKQPTVVGANSSASDEILQILIKAKLCISEGNMCPADACRRIDAAIAKLRQWNAPAEHWCPLCKGAGTVYNDDGGERVCPGCNGKSVKYRAGDNAINKNLTRRIK